MFPSGCFSAEVKFPCTSGASFRHMALNVQASNNNKISIRGRAHRSLYLSDNVSRRPVFEVCTFHDVVSVDSFTTAVFTSAEVVHIHEEVASCADFVVGFVVGGSTDEGSILLVRELPSFVDECWACGVVLTVEVCSLALVLFRVCFPVCFVEIVSSFFQILA